MEISFSLVNLVPDLAGGNLTNYTEELSLLVVLQCSTHRIVGNITEDLATIEIHILIIIFFFNWIITPLLIPILYL